MASIPLPALATQPPAQAPNALEQYARMMQIKGEQQNQQMGAVQLQQAQQQQKDQKTLGQLMIKNNGNLDKVIQDAPQAGVMPNTVRQLQAHALEVKTKMAGLNADQLKNFATTHDNAAGLIQPVLDAKTPEAKDAAYQASLQAAAQNPQMYGINDPSQLPPQRPPDDVLKTQLALHMGQKAQADQALKTTEGAKNTAQAGEAVANTGKLQAELNFYQKNGMAAGVPLDAQEAADWISKNPGKGPADFAKFKAGLSAQANASAQAGLLTDSAKKMAADAYAQTGQLPSGMRSPAMSAQVLNTAAGGPNGVPNIAANKMNYKADSGSLDSLQKNFDQVTAFENTAGKNLDVFLGQAQKVIDSGNPLINRPLRSITGAMGGTDQAAFDAARTTALTEISKVLNSSNASGVLSDSARHEVSDLIKPNATLQQIVSAANILKADMANRHQAYQDQITSIKGRGQQPNASAPTSYTPPAGAQTAVGPGGHKIVVDGGKWVDAVTGKPI